MMFWSQNVMVLELDPSEGAKEISFTMAPRPEDVLRVRYRLPERNPGER